MIRIGVLAPSEIAFRRFVPAVKKSSIVEYVGVACASAKEWNENSCDTEIIPVELAKAERFQDTFGGKVFRSYRAMLESTDIDAVYVPLPPGLHYRWGQEVIDSGKHLLMEKPFSDSYAHTTKLIDRAIKKNVAVHENFAFVYHKQIEEIRKLIADGVLGELRLIRTAFGFPYRGESDFRYHRSMGGGALLDCGGYPTRLAHLLLGTDSHVATAALSSAKGHDVDVFGSATLINDDNLTAQISFGMDNSYKCELEIWGSKGVLQTPRIFTPTAEMSTVIHLKTDDTHEIVIQPDDQFLHSAEFFAECIRNSEKRRQRIDEILRQSKLMEEIRRLAE